MHQWVESGRSVAIMQPMHLDEIEAFVRVVEAGSFTAAAKHLGLPKSTLSRALTRLEEATHARLLRRTTRSIALTESGRRFFDQVAPHVGGLRDAMTVLFDEEDQPKGLLRMTLPVDMGEAILADIITKFVARYPGIEVHVDATGRVVNLVEEGYDVAIRASSKLRDSSLVARKVGVTDLHLFAAPSYLARRGTPKTAEDLEGHDLVLFQAPGSREESPDLRVGDKRLAARLVTSEFAFLRATLTAGAGIGLLPSFHASGDCSDGRLVRVLPDFSRPGGAVYILYPSGRHVPKKVTLFRDFLLESFANLACNVVRTPAQKTGRPR